MNAKAFDFWMEFFGSRSRLISGDNRTYSLGAVPMEIMENYRSLFAFLNSVNDMSAMGQLKDIINSFISQIPTYVVKQDQDTSIEFSANFPLIRDIQKASPDLTIVNFGPIGLAAMLYELGEIPYNLEITSQSAIKTKIERFYTEYGARKVILSQQTEASQIIDSLNHRTFDAISQSKLSSEQIEILKKKLLETIQQATSSSQAVLSDAREWIETSRSEVEAIKVAALDRANLTEARKLWEDMAKETRTAFRVGFWATTALLAFAALFIILRHGEIADYIVMTSEKLRTTDSAIEGGSASTIVLLSMYVTRLFFVAVPAFVVFWLARFGMRFTLQSRALFDDARQRQAMIATYIHMLQEQQLDLSHRPLMLAAIFRPLPGHSGFDVEPPYLAEALKGTKPE